MSAIILQLDLSAFWLPPAKFRQFHCGDSCRVISAHVCLCEHLAGIFRWLIFCVAYLSNDVGQLGANGNQRLASGQPTDRARQHKARQTSSASSNGSEQLVNY